jgi:hypothetical protein
MSHVVSLADKTAASQRILERLYILVQERLLPEVDLGLEKIPSPVVEGAVMRLVLALVEILKPDDKSCTVRPSDLIVGMDLHKIGRQLGINGVQMQGVMRVVEEVFLAGPIFAEPTTYYQDGKIFIFTRHSESYTFTISRP